MYEGSDIEGRFQSPDVTNRPDKGFGARLRALRLRRGLAQKDLAGPGVSMSYVSRLESGDRVPSPAVIDRLAETLGVEPSELLGDSVGAADQEAALIWCEAVLAYRDGDPDRAIDLLGVLAEKAGDSMFGWSVRWWRAALLAKSLDPQPFLEACEELRRKWSPGNGVDAHVELMRAEALRRLGQPAESIRAAYSAVELATRSDVSGAGNVRRHVVIRLCMQLTRTGRLAEAAEAIEQLDDLLHDAPADHLTATGWWVRAQVEQRIGKSEASAASMRTALRILDQFNADPMFRNRVRLAAVLTALRSDTPDLTEVTDTLDLVDAEIASQRTQLAAQVATLRAEVALRKNNTDECWELAQQALSSGLLDEEDQMYSRLLQVRAADQAGDAERVRASKAELATLLEEVGIDVVDPVMWRDVARFVLRATAAPAS